MYIQKGGCAKREKSKGKSDKQEEIKADSKRWIPGRFIQGHCRTDFGWFIRWS